LVGSGLKSLSPSIFILVLICFFLPFTKISCGGEEVMSFTGFQLVTGTTIEVGGGIVGKGIEDRKTERVDPEPYAIWAFGAGIVGLVLSFIKSRGSKILSAIIGIVGAVSLLLLKSKLDRDVLRAGEGAFHIEYQFGFWLAFILFFSAVFLNIYLFSLKETYPMIEDTSSRHCPYCGAELPQESIFCPNCGKKL